jgi:hypothetical protein
VRSVARIFLAAVVALTLTAVVSGLSLLYRNWEEPGAPEERPTTTISSSAEAWPLARIAHAVAAHLAVVTAFLLAAATMVLGLQALLDHGGRRWSGAALFLLSPLVLGLVIVADVTGLVRGSDWPVRDGVIPDAARFVDVHAIRLPAMLVACLALIAALIAWVTRPQPDR